MSENRDGGMDLSRIVGLIMENPKLISEISELVREKGQAEEKRVTPEEVATVTNPTPLPEPAPRERRAALLCALKPYVSEGRAKAIDSMMSIADILDMMRTN